MEIHSLTDSVNIYIPKFMPDITPGHKNLKMIYTIKLNIIELYFEINDTSIIFI